MKRNDCFCLVDMAVISDFQQVMLNGQIKHDISGSATMIGLI